MAQDPGYLGDMAWGIIRRYLSRVVQEEAAEEPDQVRQRIALFLRELLYVRELGIAISDGDWGRIEDIFLRTQDASMMPSLQMQPKPSQPTACSLISRQTRSVLECPGLQYTRQIAGQRVCPPPISPPYK